jgi:nucleoid DNA-binding protein
MTHKTNKSGRIDSRHLTTISRANLGEAIQSSLSSWPSTTRKHVPAMVDNVVWRIIQAIEERQAVRLKKTGNLTPSFKPERGGVRNIKSGEPTFVSERWVVSFKRSLSRDNCDVFGWSDMLQHLINLYGSNNEFSFTINEARELYTAFTQQIRNILHGTTRIELRGLGSFHPAFIKGQPRRNPKTGESVLTEDSIAIRFRLSSKLASRINLAG